MQSITDLWMDREEGDEHISPPVQTRVQILPFGQLTWENFERLCARLAARETDISDWRRYGVQGQDQQGIDLYVRRKTDGAYETWQCKKVKNFGVSDLEEAVTNFLANEWSRRSTCFYVAVTVSLSRSELAEAVIAQTERCFERGLQLVPLDAEALSDRLKGHVDLVDDFFGRPWVEAFCGTDALRLLAKRPLSKKDRIEARKKLLALYRTHFASVDVGLPALAGPLSQVTTPPSLHQRFVEPLVNSVVASLEPNTVRDEEGNPYLDLGATTIERGKPDALALRRTRMNGFKVVEHPTKTTLSHWLDGVKQGIVLAGPGSGKSSVLRFIALDLLSDQPRFEVLARQWGNYLPILVPFAMLTRLTSTENVTSVPDFIRKWLQQLSAPANTIDLFERALEDERILLLVDGLDEWNDLTAAETAKVTLLDFALPRNLPVIASARPAGYEKLGRLGHEWKRADLLPFEYEQQKIFAEGWFQHFHRNASADELSLVNIAATRDTELFMADVDEDPALSELGGIPLMLAVMICLRLKGRLLPRNRFDALSAMTETLIVEQPRRRALSSMRGRGDSRQNSRISERGIECLALSIHEHTGSDSISEAEAREILRTLYQGGEFKKSEADAIEMAAYQVESASHEVGILVMRELDRIGFVHRSLQEFLAAKAITHWSFDRQKTFFIKNCAAPVWRDVLLAVLHLTQRQNEIDEFLEGIRKAEVDWLEAPSKAFFLARAVFGDIHCSPELASQLAEETFDKVETLPWMPIRKALLAQCVHGMASETVGDLTRKRLARWFPGRQRWGGVFEQLAKMPLEKTAHQLYVGLFNTDYERERKTIAEAIGAQSARWAQLADKLVGALGNSTEGEVAGCVLHALALGWPDHPSVEGLLLDASKSSSEPLSCVASIHRVRRGDRSVQVKELLCRFMASQARIYEWEDEVIQSLSDGWPGDIALRDIALRSARGDGFPSVWNDRAALDYLTFAFPQDDNVATLIAAELKKGRHLGGHFGFMKTWEVVKRNFIGHPIVAAGIEDWLDRHGMESYDEPNIAHLAMIARTDHCKTILLKRLRGKIGVPWWMAEALVDIYSADDVQVREAVLPYIRDAHFGAGMASYAPAFLNDVNQVYALILGHLEAGNPVTFGSIFDGLEEIGRLRDQKVKAVIQRRLKNDPDGLFWWATRIYLLRHFSDLPEVKEKAIATFDEQDSVVSEIAAAYASDDDIRGALDALTEVLHPELRLELVRCVGPYASRHDPFAHTLLSRYENEWNSETRCVAAYSYYLSVSANGEASDAYQQKLTQELTAQGPSFDESRTAAVAGLIGLQKSEVLLKPLFYKDGKPALPLELHMSAGNNWEFLRIVIDSWDTLALACGESVWKIFPNFDQIICQLEVAGKIPKNSALPPLRVSELRQHALSNLNSFKALSILERGQSEFRDLCVTAFGKTRIEKGPVMASWGYYDVLIWFEAANYLATYHRDDRELPVRLTAMVADLSDPSGPIIALCRGWPETGLIDAIWRQIQEGGPSAEPSAAWVSAVRANSQEFATYVLAVPRLLRGNQLWAFPSETIGAIRRRLTSDPKIIELLMKSIEETDSVELGSSLLRLIGTVARERESLRTGARNLLRRHTAEGRLSPYGYDMISGATRPLQNSLLEACLL